MIGGRVLETWASAELKPRLRETPIAVLMGGTSVERDVSLTSGRAIVQALKDLSGPSFDVAPPISTVEIDEAGEWVIDGLALPPERAICALPSETLYFLALHGGSGEDGRIQAFLEIAGRTHTGAAASTSALCMDKHRSRLVAQAAGVRVADGAYVTRAGFLRDPEAALDRLLSVESRATFVKHCAGGSSFGVYRCGSDNEIRAAAEEIAKSGGDILLEAEIHGLETTAGLVGDGADAACLPIVEIVPKEGAYFDFEQKYSSEGGAAETCPPKVLSAALAERIQSRALTAWDAFAGTGYGRVDFIVPRDTDGSIAANAEPVLLEANTLPGFTPRSLLPLAAGAAGVGFRELVLEVSARALSAQASTPESRLHNS